jgi:dihydrofolate synthase/folylpolyglutamate synthase
MLPLVQGMAQLGAAEVEGAEAQASARLIAVGIPSCPRACEAQELAALLGPQAEAAPDVHAALERLREVPGPVLVCGSLYLLGEFYTQHPRLLERGPSPSTPRRS